MKSLIKTFSFRSFDYTLVFMVAALTGIGIVAIGSAQHSLQNRQIAGMLLGLAVMLAVSLVDYSFVLDFYWVWYGLTIFLLVLVLIVGSGRDDAYRWISIAGITFQPSEAAKILLILFYAKFIMLNKERIKSFLCFVVCFLLILPPVFLIYEQPDMSTAIMLIIIFAFMMFIGGMSGRLAATIVIVSVPTVIVLINLIIQGSVRIVNNYQRGRILAWLHPEDYANSLAFQTMNSIMAIGSGQLFGKGYNSNEFSSLLNSGYISESQTDFIFTVIGEEFGFVGACTVVVLLMLISVRIFIISKECSDSGDTAGAVIAGGIGAWIGFQGFMNIGVATGVMINTGIPLPFVSYGLTSLLCLYAGIGFILNVRMQTRQKRQPSATHQALHWKEMGLR